jgi:hypothetical protein
MREHSEVCISKHLVSYPKQSKTRCFISIASEYAIMTVQGIQVRLKLQVFADVNILAEHRNHKDIPETLN